MMNQNQKRGLYVENEKTKNIMKRIGIFLFILSWILYGIALIVPFTPIPTNTKVILVPIFIVLGEIAFWVSCVILGKELIKRYKKYLIPANWFKKSGE